MSSSHTSDAAAHPHHKDLIAADGSWKYTNALALETSPYLLQHAHNPVNWLPWGPAAFEQARQSGKPIFLSIGYSTCYWCHVMERLVFENPDIAAQMNDGFVNIKVDREERPDIDDIYMTAVQIMTGRGGWPMSVFLTPPQTTGENDPGLQPFYAGTYFPPEPTHGLPGFPQVLKGIADVWKNQRSEIAEQAQRLAQSVREQLTRHRKAMPLGPYVVQEAANQLLRHYDQEHGGFGSAPKFPQPSNLLFLIRVHRNNPAPSVWEAVLHTLDRMARGGLYDQIGSGFHRYATDEKWLVPHFEKMLYDNGQLVEAYVEAHVTDPAGSESHLFPRIIRQTCAYVLREMTDASGAFWSAQDAEVQGREGGNYVWTADQVRAALPDRKLADLAVAMYGLDQGPNFRDPHHPQAQPVNVLHLPQSLPDLAKARGMELEKLLAAKDEIDCALYGVRQTRPQPATDDKILVSWNGMMIAGLAMAGRVLSLPDFVEGAKRAAQAILDRLRQPDGTLHRTMRGQQSKIAAFLEDYAFFIHGLIELHRATGDAHWLDTAASLEAVVAQRFGPGSEEDAGRQQGGGACYDTLPGQSDLFVRTRSTYDGAIPSGNSQMVHNLLDLYQVTKEPRYLDRALAVLEFFSADLSHRGHSMIHMIHALLRVIEIAPGRFATELPEEATTRRRPLSIAIDPQEVDLASGAASIRLTLHIGDEYHLTANDSTTKGLRPTTLVLRGGDGMEMEVAYPPGQEKRYALADEPLRVYEGTVDLTVTLLRPKALPADAQPRLVLHAQLCTDMNCLEPLAYELPIVFTGLR